MLKHFFRLFSPNSCILCGNSMHDKENIFCFECNYSLPKTNFHLTTNENALVETFWGKINIKHATAFYYYTKGLKVQKLIHFLKYKNRPDIGFDIGIRYGKILKENPLFANADYIVPVPLHPKKLKKRGYNQAEEFAKGLSKSLSKPIENNNLIKITHTDTQTKKGRFARWQNVSEVFKLTNPDLFSNKKIILVDDVITTGATIESCINQINTSKNASIYLVSIAFASN